MAPKKDGKSASFRQDSATSAVVADGLWWVEEDKFIEHVNTMAFQHEIRSINHASYKSEIWIGTNACAWYRLKAKDTRLTVPFLLPLQKMLFFDHVIPKTHGRSCQTVIPRVMKSLGYGPALPCFRRAQSTALSVRDKSWFRARCHWEALAAYKGRTKDLFENSSSSATHGRSSCGGRFLDRMVSRRALPVGTQVSKFSWTKISASLFTSSL